jgi:hypothetical protein
LTGCGAAVAQGQLFKDRQFTAEMTLWVVRWHLMFPVSYRELWPKLQDRGVWALWTGLTRTNAQASATKAAKFVAVFSHRIATHSDRFSFLPMNCSTLAPSRCRRFGKASAALRVLPIRDDRKRSAVGTLRHLGSL